MEKTVSVTKLDMLEQIGTLAYYADLPNENVLLSYRGSITTKLIAEMDNEIVQKVKNRSAGRKLHNIFLELAQNIFYYSAEINQFGDVSPVGTIVLSEGETAYHLFTGNLITKKQANFLDNQAQKIKTLDTEGLRKYRMEIVENDNPNNPDSKGAGVGLIKATLVSENPLHVDLQPVNDLYAYYTLLITVSKNNNSTQKKSIQMETLHIKSNKGEFYTPYVMLNGDTGVCELAGESYLEYTNEFYAKIISWIDKFTKESTNKITFNFRLTYFNTSSYKAILDTLRSLKAYQNKGGKVEVNWFYPEDDTDIVKEAQDLSESAKLDMNFIGYEIEDED
jgi:hypothetical protein